jgi:hypothetical protein
MSKTNPNTPDERGSLPPQHNKAGNQSPTPRNEPRRTIESRNDREDQRFPQSLSPETPERQRHTVATPCPIATKPPPRSKP